MLNVDKAQLSELRDIRIGNASLFSIIESAEKKYNIQVITEDIVKSFIPKIPRTAHKYTCGKSVMICGSYGMAGAAAIAGCAAYKSGAGLVDMIMPDSIYPIVGRLLPEAVFTPLPSSNFFGTDHVDTALQKIKSSRALLIGCGLSCSKDTADAVKQVLENVDIPTIIDADGINCIKDCIEILERTDWDKIITPHFGEMARITGMDAAYIAENFIDVAVDFATKHNVIVVLKGAFTVVATPYGRVHINLLYGNAGMAVGGSGDMLSGIMCALLASGIDAANAAVAAVYLHACAGDMAAKKLSMHSITPMDMIDQLPCLFKNFE